MLNRKKTVREQLKKTELYAMLPAILHHRKRLGKAGATQPSETAGRLSNMHETIGSATR